MMQWFKHFHFASKDDALVKLMEEYRAAGYAYYFLLLELCYEVWVHGDPPHFKFHKRVLSRRLTVTAPKLNQLFHRMSTLGLFTYTFSSDVYHVDFPKLLEVMGRDDKREHKNRGKPAGGTRQIRSDKIRLNNNAPPAVRFDFDALYDLFPRKKGKAAGLKKLLRIVKTKEQYDAMQFAINNYVASIRKEGTDPKYVMYFSSFVNGKWEDYAPEKNNASNKLTSKVKKLTPEQEAKKVLGIEI